MCLIAPLQVRIAVSHYKKTDHKMAAAKKGTLSMNTLALMILCVLLFFGIVAFIIVKTRNIIP